ncbi:MAG: glycosyl transferase family 1, partial [Pseudomonadota bacterium]
MTGECALQDNGVLVLGMHRSGTSAVAACLERLGVHLGDALVPADKWNPKGYFEERRIVAFNNRLLDLQGLRWDSPLPPAPALQAAWCGQAEAAAALLQELFAGTFVWGFKDPRMCLLAPFWQPVFAAMRLRPRMLLVLRHPAEVTDSLARRDGMATRRAGWLWFTHLLGALDYLKSATDGRLIDFADLLSEPARQLGALGDWLGLSRDEADLERFANDFIAPQLAHGAGAQAPCLDPLILRAYHY